MESRSELAPADFDRLKHRVSSRLHRPVESPKGSFMKSRLAVVLALAFGIITSGSGVALGVNALSNTDDAAKAQYGCPNPPCGGFLPGAGGGGDDDGDNGDNGDLQAQQQLAQGDGTGSASGELPFTGYLAIPMLAVGCLMLVVGLVLGRRWAHDAPQS